MSWPSTSIRTKNWGREKLFAVDLSGQLDILHAYENDQLNGTTGHGHTGGTSDGKKIDLTTSVLNALPIANGGTGVATLAALGNLFYPIGSEYKNYVDSTNPATLLGFGTWAAVSGFTAGIDGSTEFLSAGQTGGAKTVSLAAHRHKLELNGASSDGAATFYSGVTSQGGIIYSGEGIGTTIQALNSQTDVDGGGQSIATLPPYIACYVWKRTA